MIAADLTTQELSKNIDKIAVLPYGSFEQHGPYLPLSTDTIIAEEICKRIENALPDNIMLFPTIWIGDSEEHKGFPGTISTNVFTSMTLLKEIFSWLQDSGFKRCLLYVAHGGNINLSKAICEEFSRANNLKIKSYYAFNSKVEDKAVELFNYCEAHAGSVETSLVYALRPDLKKTDETTINNKTPYQSGFSYFKTKDLTENGILNNTDSIEIDVKKGQIIIDTLVQEGIKVVEKLSEIK